MITGPVSPDSGEHWTEPGAWPAAPGVHRIPLPLPTDGLKAVNVYVLEADDGLTLIDAGWALEVARDLLDASLRSLGHATRDISRFLVTHVHRDHYTQAVTVRRDFGAHISLGLGEKPTLDALLDQDGRHDDPHIALLHQAGAHDLAEQWRVFSENIDPDLSRVGLPRHLARRRPRDSRWASAPSTRSRRPGTPRATTCSPTGPPDCCSRATTCCPPSPRRSASSRCRRPRRWPTSSARSPRCAGSPT